MHPCKSLGGLLLSLALPASAAGSASPPVRDMPSLWAASCAYCHDRGVAPALGGRALPPRAVQSIVRRGGVQMPPFAATDISPGELSQLARWVSALPAAGQQP